VTHVGNKTHVKNFDGDVLQQEVLGIQRLRLLEEGGVEKNVGV
jgi:hypothetical protein